MQDRWDALRRQLAGRTKRDLIEGMVVRSPHRVALEKLVVALEAYPLYLLMLAHDHPTRIWLLDRGEPVSSAAILDDEARGRRWHSAGITVDECDGLTDVVGDQVVMVVSWKTLLLMRHEFAHVVTTFFSPRVRGYLETLYAHAKQRGAFTEPLAAESLGEYIACGLSYYFFPDLRDELLQVDEPLYRLVDDILRRAEAVSARMQDMADDSTVAILDEPPTH